MSNRFHILLEVPPKRRATLNDEQPLLRIGGLCSKAFVATVARELAEARVAVAKRSGTGDGGGRIAMDSQGFWDEGSSKAFAWCDVSLR